MAEREKVIKEIARIRDEYFGEMTSYEGDVLDAALALLKAQGPRVMMLNEMYDKRGRGEAVYYEDRDATCKSQDVFVIAQDKYLDVVWLKAETYTLAAKMSTMGKTWRCWTARPDEKVRAETPWEAQ